MIEEVDSYDMKEVVEIGWGAVSCTVMYGVVGILRGRDSRWRLGCVEEKSDKNPPYFIWNATST